MAQTPYSAYPGSTTRIERLAGATTDLQQSGFKVHIVNQPTSDPNQDGIVLSQNPAGGAQAKPGSPVTITVGRITNSTTTTTTTTTP